MASGPVPADAAPTRPTPDLLARLRARADADGFVPFDRFMDLALYDPRAGFYSRESAAFGSAGDYYTAPYVHPLFARTLAARIRTLVGPIRDHGPVRIVEVGPGDGSLAEGLLRSLGAESRVDEYLLVERSESLARRALARAGAAGE
ncbi:MAG: SAM-dependent methyltransferase, partial [Thermoplasmata archaeon]